MMSRPYFRLQFALALLVSLNTAQAADPASPITSYCGNPINSDVVTEALTNGDRLTVFFKQGIPDRASRIFSNHPEGITVKHYRDIICKNNLQTNPIPEKRFVGRLMNGFKQGDPTKFIYGRYVSYNKGDSIYNATNQPLKITHADGTSTHFVYGLDSETRIVLNSETVISARKFHHDGSLTEYTGLAKFSAGQLPAVLGSKEILVGNQRTEAIVGQALVTHPSGALKVLWAAADLNDSSYTPAQMDYLAQNATVVAIPHYYGEHKLSEHKAAATSLKLKNPNIKALYYFNSTQIFTKSELFNDINFNRDSWLLHTMVDNPPEPIVRKYFDVIRNGERVQSYFSDLSISGFRNWVVARLKNIVESSDFDGVVLDSANLKTADYTGTYEGQSLPGHHSHTPLGQLISADKMRDVNTGLHRLIQSLGKELGETAPIYFNGIWRKADNLTINRSLNLLNHGASPITERTSVTFENDVSLDTMPFLSTDKIMKDLELYSSILQQNKSILFHDYLKQEWVDYRLNKDGQALDPLFQQRCRVS